MIKSVFSLWRNETFSKEVRKVEIIVKGSFKEIAAFVLEIQKQHTQENKMVRSEATECQTAETARQAYSPNKIYQK